MIDYLAQEIGSLFVKLASRYGSEWTLKWANVEPQAIAKSWREELQAFAGSQQYVAAIFDEAMRHLPERPVNAVQFRVLCQQARDTLYRQAKDRLREQEGKPVRGPTPEERAELLRLREEIASGSLFARPSSEWAHRLVARAQAGERVSFAGLKLASEVVQADARRRAVPDAFGAHPSALEGDDVDPLPPLPELPQEAAP